MGDEEHLSNVITSDMGKSFYIVFLVITILLLEILDIHLSNNYWFIIFMLSNFIACIAIVVLCRPIRHYLDYQKEYNKVKFLEMVYSNDYNHYIRYKRKTLTNLIAISLLFIGCIFLIFISPFNSKIETISFCVYAVGIGIFTFWKFINYLKIKRCDKVVPVSKKMSYASQNYNTKRLTNSYEDLLPSQPQNYNIVKVLNEVFAIFNIVFGILSIFLISSINFEPLTLFDRITLIILISLLPTYCGIQDLFYCAANRKWFLLLLSFAISLLLYNPCNKYVSKTLLEKYVSNRDYLHYDAIKNELYYECNIKHLKILKRFPKQRARLFLYKNNVLPLLIQNGTDFKMRIKETKETLAYIPLKELKEIYNIKISDLEAFFIELRISLSDTDGNTSYKIYDDGEYIVFEEVRNEVFTPRVETNIEIKKDFQELVEIEADMFAEDLISFKRGFIHRQNFKNGFFLEHTLSIEKIQKILEHQNNLKNKNKQSGMAISHNKKPVTFCPQNAMVVDETGSHNFTSYDCPNMNVTDKGNSVDISWGGDNVTLNRSANNSDTYTATGNTPRGNLTIKAFRSSASGKIYLVTATMPNPTSDVRYITINFKP